LGRPRLSAAVALNVYMNPEGANSCKVDAERNLARAIYTLFHAGGGRLTVAYCVKCKAKREIKNPQKITMKNGKPAMTGTCPVCGTKLFRIGG
jgi:hypothetical protein